jgi:hypothetical protein
MGKSYPIFARSQKSYEFLLSRSLFVKFDTEFCVIYNKEAKNQTSLKRLKSNSEEKDDVYSTTRPYFNDAPTASKRKPPAIYAQASRF